MSAPTESAAVLAVVRNARRPYREYAELLESVANAREALEQDHGLLADELTAAASREIEGWRGRGIEVVTLLDPGYPPNLRAVHDRPPLIFLSGTLQPADERAVAVIGSRRPTARGQTMARAIARELVDRRYTVVSGLADGIDTAAHEATLAEGGRTIAVIGTGLTHCYPPANRDLQRRIGQECAVVSRFWPDTRATRGSFPLRNAVMSGMSRASVIVEASATSGARTQARLALAHGRPVLLLDSLLKQTWARELAERPGTYVVASPADVTTVVERVWSGTLTG